MKKLGIILVVFCSLALWASDEVEKLESINKQIKRVESSLSKLEKEKKSLLKDMAVIELKRNKEVIENRKIKLQILAKRKTIDSKKADVKKLKKSIDISRANIAQALRVLYKLGRSAYVKFFTKVESFNDLFKNYQLFSALVNYKSAEIETLRRDVAKLNRINRELQLDIGNLEVLRKQQEEKIAHIANLKRRKQILVDRINNDKKGFFTMLDELKAEAKSLDNMIKKRGLVSGFPTLNLKNIKGKLRWPLSGKVVSTFGKKKSTQFDTYIINNGIEIRPAGGDKIQALYAGKVIFADYFKGYGNLIIVQHSKDFHSLYGHCEKMLKKIGDKITEGEVIALVGETGSTYGKSLYLEVRKDLKPQDPLKWLRKR